MSSIPIIPTMTTRKRGRAEVVTTDTEPSSIEPSALTGATDPTNVTTEPPEVPKKAKATANPVEEAMSTVPKFVNIKNQSKEADDKLAESYVKDANKLRLAYILNMDLMVIYIL